MLSVEARVRNFKKEMDSIALENSKLFSKLYYFENKVYSEEELLELISELASEMPEYKILTKERDELVEIIHKICTKELEPLKAIDILNQNHEDIMKARELIKC